ncbi:EamA-like transporter [Aureococcus anophagefferens]|nr:EamA-like transporter [Aureococcus anophagefferens]
MPSQIAPRTALILACAAPAAAFAPGRARALPPLLATEDPSRTASYLKKLAPAPETALRAEEENAYLATLESTGGLAPARSTPRAPYDAEYLDELDRSTWASTLFQKELARRGVGAAAGEVEYLEGLDAGGEPEESSPLAWRGAMLFVTVAWATNFALTAFACED